MNLASAKFVKSAPTKKDFLLDKKQVCFLGKSNVGKSSLINSLCSNKKLVYVSKTPGCTKMLNYFLLENRAYLVDAPGYGYYKDASFNFEDMMLDYFSLSKKKLVCAYLLLDSSRKVSEDDLAIIDLLNENQIEFVIVFTKFDKLNQKEKSAIKKERDLYFKDRTCFFTSSSEELGIKELRGDISTRLS